MSDPTIIAFLTKLLCSHGGRLPRDQLPEFLDLPSEQIDQILQDEPQKFPQVGVLVLARNSARICTKYLKNEPEEECDKLHLCRQYLQGKCWPGRRPECRFSHNILSDHNQPILKANEISGLNDSEIKVLLLQNDNQLLPEVCVKYLHDQCYRGENCMRLHICGYFTRGECNRRGCRRSHDLLELSSDLIARCGMSEVSVQNFQMLCTVKHSERLQSQRMEYETCNPAAWRGRRRGRGTNRTMGDSRDLSQNNNRGRQQKRAGPNFRGRSSSRPMTKSVERLGWFGDDDDDGDDRLERLIAHWFPESSLLSTQESSLGVPHPTPTVSKVLTTSPKASSQPGIANSLLSSSSTPSSSQPKLTTTLVTTAGQDNAPPVNVHMKGPSTTAGQDNAPPVNVHIKGPSTTAGQDNAPPVNVHMKGPSTTAGQANAPPVNVHIKGPSTTAGQANAPPVKVPMKGPSTTAEQDNAPPVNGPMKGPSATAGHVNDPPGNVPMKGPSTTAGQDNAPPVNVPMGGPLVVGSDKPVTNPVVNPSTVPLMPPRPSRLVYPLMKGPSDDKPVTTPVASSYSATPAVTFNKTVTSPATSPSSASSPSYSRLVYGSMKGPSDPQDKPVQSNVRSQPVPDNKPIYSGHPADTTSMYGATYASPKRPEPDRVPDICLFNVWKYCKLGKLCPDMHYYLPYCWQINRGAGWEEISNMEEIEKQYCDPKMDRIPSIDFLTMRSGVPRVRRLSTVSSVVKPSEYVLTTEWLWYWKDEYGTWTQYGNTNVKQVSSNILSSDLENVYLSDPTATIPFCAGNQYYEIKFREMKQKNLAFQTEKDVRRRPKFLRFEDVKLLRGSTKSAAAQSPLRSSPSPLKTDLYPRTWEAGAMPEIGCTKVLISDTSSEFSEIDSSFSKTVSGHVVKKMWRLQNPSLWQVFQWQKIQMKKVNQGRDVMEIRLFHGTEKTHIDAICNYNFDWRICGTHGTVYGQGSYFARDASYSHNYSTPTASGTRTMFVARVLVGDYVVGSSEMKRPPQRPGSSLRYFDSCVDAIISPSIFVVFEKPQIYPEYLLEYEEEKKKSCVIC